MAKQEIGPNIVILSLSASEPSVGRQCLPTLQKAIQATGALVTVWDIRDLPPVWVDKRDLHSFPPPYAALYANIEACDGVLLIVPVHCYGASGPAKSLTEIIGDALTRKPVAVVSAAGTIRSHLAMRDLMTSMMFEQETICYPGTVQATEEMFKNGRPNADLKKRLSRLAKAFSAFVIAVRPFLVEYGTEEE